MSDGSSNQLEKSRCATVGVIINVLCTRLRRSSSSCLGFEKLCVDAIVVRVRGVFCVKFFGKCRLSIAFKDKDIKSAVLKKYRELGLENAKKKRRRLERPFHKKRSQFVNINDDTQIYISFNTTDVATSKQRVEDCVAEICHWMNSNELKLNHDMLIHSRYHNKPPVDDFNIELEKVPITAALVKSLGVGFDEHMMFDSYVAINVNLPFTI
ncbi:Hypothetical predicted protein, partial [Paramuricea clavata]